MDRLLLPFLRRPSRLRHYHKSPIPSTVDYIIVGAGSAGCVLANRLSAHPANKVLLVEAGNSDDHMFIGMPAAFIKLFNSNYAYQYHSEEEPNLENSKIFIPQGKTLGGSSSINAMAYLRYILVQTSPPLILLLLLLLFHLLLLLILLFLLFVLLLFF